MSSVFQAGPCVRTNQLDFDDETVYKATQYLYDHARQRTDQPFCLTVSMTHPHDPYAMTKDFWDLYEDVDIPLPTVPAGDHDQLDPHSQRVLKICDGFGKKIPEERIKAARRAYFAACSYVDAQVGHLLNTLENCGLADDTIVVFSGDHGDMLGERGLWYKMVWYENSARVPMVVHAPGRYNQKRVKENVSTMDLLPTFVDMSGGSLFHDLPMDGVSLMPHLLEEEDKSGQKTNTVLGEYMGEATLAPTVMIRRGPWKFVYCPLDPPMLYNVEQDPTEVNNLAAGTQLPVHLPERAAAQNTPEKGAAANGTTGATGANTLPTPDATGAVNGNGSVFFKSTHLPTPPRSPSPLKQLPSLAATVSVSPSPATTTSPENTDVPTVLAAFLDEVHARWDFDALHAQVLHSQRRRRLVYSALSKGKVTTWDHTPVVNGP